MLNLSNTSFKLQIIRVVITITKKDDGCSKLLRMQDSKKCFPFKQQIDQTEYAIHYNANILQQTKSIPLTN